MRACSGPVRVGSLALAVGWLLWSAGCGGDPYYLHECDGSQAAGVWDVSLDYGEGVTGLQRWTITRDNCTLDIVAEPRNEYTLNYGFVNGHDDPGFWGTSINTVGPCDYYLDMTVTIVGNSFTGPIDWHRSANRTGDCAPAKGRIMATAVRH